jgi:hypothetical protein
MSFQVKERRCNVILISFNICFFQFAGTERKTKNCEFKSGDQEPWVYRGGLLGEFRVRAVFSL